MLLLEVKKRTSQTNNFHEWISEAYRTVRRFFDFVDSGFIFRGRGGGEDERRKDNKSIVAARTNQKKAIFCGIWTSPKGKSTITWSLAINVFMYCNSPLHKRGEKMREGSCTMQSECKTRKQKVLQQVFELQQSSFDAGLAFTWWESKERRRPDFLGVGRELRKAECAECFFRLLVSLRYDQNYQPVLRKSQKAKIVFVFSERAFVAFNSIDYVLIHFVKNTCKLCDKSRAPSSGHELNSFIWYTSYVPGSMFSGTFWAVMRYMCNLPSSTNPHFPKAWSSNGGGRLGNSTGVYRDIVAIRCR